MPVQFILLSAPKLSWRVLKYRRDRIKPSSSGEIQQQVDSMFTTYSKRQSSSKFLRVIASIFV